MVQPPTRLLWADSIRIVAIFLVISTHFSNVPLAPTPQNFGAYLTFAVSKTCFPLFVMLSGALLLSKKESYLYFFFKRTRLFLPWIFWGAVYLLFQQDFNDQVHSMPSFFRALVTSMQSFWFLPMIVALYLLTPIFRFFVQASTTRDHLYILIIWFLSISILPYHHNSMAFPFQVDNGIVRQVIHFSGFYLLGYVLANLKATQTRLKVYTLICFIVGFVWVIFNIFTVNPGINTISYLMDYHAPGTVILATGIFIALLRISRKWEPKIGTMMRDNINVISGATLGVYFIHQLLMRWMPYFRVGIFNDIDSYLNAFLYFGISLIIILFLKQIPLLKRVVS